MSNLLKENVLKNVVVNRCGDSAQESFRFVKEFLELRFTRPGSRGIGEEVGSGGFSASFPFLPEPLQSACFSQPADLGNYRFRCNAFSQCSIEPIVKDRVETFFIKFLYCAGVLDS